MAGHAQSQMHLNNFIIISSIAKTTNSRQKQSNCTEIHSSNISLYFWTFQMLPQFILDSSIYNKHLNQQSSYCSSKLHKFGKTNGGNSEIMCQKIISNRLLSFCSSLHNYQYTLMRRDRFAKLVEHVFCKLRKFARLAQSMLHLGVQSTAYLATDLQRS